MSIQDRLERPVKAGGHLIETILQMQWVRYFLIALWGVCLLPTCGARTSLLWFAVTFVAGSIRSRVEASLARRHANTSGPMFAIAATLSGGFWAAAPVLAWMSDAPFNHGTAVTFLACGYFLVATQLRDRPLQALIVSSPYTAAAAVIAWMAWGTPTIGPFLAALPMLWVALAVHMLLSHIMAAKLEGAMQAQASLIAELQAARDAQAAANAAKSTFLATMSHEIRTPLNGVLGMAQALAGSKLDRVQREQLEIIHESGEALLAILNDVLDLSKIEAGKLEVERIAFDLWEVAHGAHSAFTALANKKGLSFALDVEAARGRYLGDPVRIRQILYNLISNALKFTANGEIRVTARRIEGRVELAVADTGIGIAPENLERLFRKFDQLDSSTTRKFGGTGLGLSISDELARLMGGAISVRSAPGEGSVFTLSLPLTFLGEEAAPLALAPPPAGALEAIGLRVLAAEDNEVNQLVLKTLLHQMGVQPTVVADGAQAVEAWRGGAWDLILMDMHMPVMDGAAATALIRKLERETGRARTPIVALSANAMAHQVEECLAAGMDAHVAKPIQAGELFAVLQAVTEGGEADAPAAARG
jgi:signal transduction histidine kinase/CheY-like chemotaxis protein